MNNFIRKNLIFILLGFTFFLIFALFFFQELFQGGFLLTQIFRPKQIIIETPQGREEWEVNQTYKIKWRAKRIDRVGIVLFKDEVPDWIIRDIPANAGVYEWKIFMWQEPSQNYRIAVFEYPWRKNNKVSYSKNFTIIGPKISSCDVLSLEKGGLYLSSDFPNLRKVFITEDKFTGNLGGLEGADQKCQAAAQKAGFQGNYKAFLGRDDILAKNRVKKEGVFVEAESGGVVFEKKTCHRLLGKDFDDFLKRFSELTIISKEKLSNDFFNKMGEVWLGRIEEASQKNCLVLSDRTVKYLGEGYSYTVTCQDWAKEKKTIEISQKTTFPKCYTPYGKLINVWGLGGLSSGISKSAFTPSLGKSCDTLQHLLCLED